MVKTNKSMIDDYKCPWCKYYFKASSGHLKVSEDGQKMICNMIRCPVCKNGIKNLWSK